MRLYHSRGHSYLVCPRLLQLDKRHGEHWEKAPKCRRGEQCLKSHKHEAVLLDPEGHLVVDFYWFPGCRPPTEEERPVCPCGRRLVHADLDDPYGPQHLVGTP